MKIAFLPKTRCIFKKCMCVYYSQWKFFMKNSWITANCLIRKIIWCTNSSNTYASSTTQLHSWQHGLKMQSTKQAAYRRNNCEDGITYECDVSVLNWVRLWTINLMPTKDKNGGHSGAVWTLRSHCKGRDWIPGGETKIPQALWPKEKKKKKDNNGAKEVNILYNLRAFTLDFLGLSILTASWCSHYA